MIFDTSQWLALAIVREIANLVEPDTGQDERAISTFSFDLTLLQAQCLNDPLKDAGLTEVFVDDEGNHYGKELGDTLKKASSRLNEKGKKRNKLHALAKKHDRQGKKAKPPPQAVCCGKPPARKAHRRPGKRSRKKRTPDCNDQDNH